jgi:arginyl-tRNA synthetase
MKKDVAIVLAEALETLGVSPLPEIDVEVPKAESHGDISTPVAMGLSKQLRRAPKKIAEEIIAAIGGKNIFEKIEIAGPGFINFTFTKEYLHESLKKLLSGDRAMLREDVGRGRRVLVEFVSANPTGPLHVGHARGAAVGNALCNLLKESGFSVEREYYINDAGRQIRLLGMSVFAKYMQEYGGRPECPFPEEGYKGDYIGEIARSFNHDFIEEAESGDFDNKEFEDVADTFISYSYRKMLDLIRDDLKSFGVSFDSWVSEKSLYERGEVIEAIDYLKDHGFTYEGEGALWFRSTDFTDDKDRVVIKSDGEYTYFASDIAYHKDKLDRGFDVIVDIWGADHHGYIPRVESVMEAFGYDSSKFRVILVQMVNLLKQGVPFQMSKRAGNFVTLSEIAGLVGADTTKFIFLTRKSDSHLDFDVDVVTAQSAENPVYYVQYANARINSIFEKAKEAGIDIDRIREAGLTRLDSDDEIGLIKKLLAWPMVLEGAARSYEPHRITFYLQDLAGTFHSYYHKFKVIGEEPETTAARLALCKAIQIVLGDALNILGVTAPKKM